MFISKEIVDQIIEEYVETLSLHPVFVDVDKTTWTEVKSVLRIIIHRKAYPEKLKKAQLAGVQRAKERGVYKGKRSKISDERLESIKIDFVSSNLNKQEVADKWGISRAYLYQLCRKKDVA